MLMIICTEYQILLFACSLGNPDLINSQEVLINRNRVAVTRTKSKSPEIVFGQAPNFPSG